VNSRFSFRRRFHRRVVPIAAAAALGLVPLAVTRADAQPGRGFGPGHGPHAGMAMHRRGGGMGGGMGIERLLARADDLGLTDAQQQKLRQIRKQTPAALMPKRQAVEEARLDFQDLMSQEKTSTADLERAHGKLLDARSKLQAAQFDLRMQVRDVLTPEQRTKIRQGLRDGARQRMRTRQPRMGWNGFDDDRPGTERF
jgi:Spy/CpxP family protein refolding chaperone